MNDQSRKEIKILVSGGAGFIGSHLIERLLKEGYKVVCLDSFNDYYDPQIKRNNIKPFLREKRFNLVEADIRDKDTLKGIFEKYKFQKIIHLAAQAGVRLSLKQPNLYVEVNVNGTLNLLELSKEYKIKNFIFGSSSSVYGVTKEIPFSEDSQIRNYDYLENLIREAEYRNLSHSKSVMGAKTFLKDLKEEKTMQNKTTNRDIVTDCAFSENFFELTKKRQSIRKFSERKISYE